MVFDVNRKATQTEIDAHRKALAELPEALHALDVLEDCGGDFEKAFERVLSEYAQKVTPTAPQGTVVTVPLDVERPELNSQEIL